MAERRLSPLLVADSIFCAGCGHGIVNRVLAESLDELNLSDSAIGVAAVGCTCWMINTFGIRHTSCLNWVNYRLLPR